MGKHLRDEPTNPAFQLVLNEDFLPENAGHRTKAEFFETKRLQDVMAQYIGYYADGDGHTARAKRYDLEHFLGFLGFTRGGPANVLMSDWTLQSTNDFIDDRLHHGESPATVSRRLATLKHFGRTIAERLPGYINPAREARAPTAAPARPEGLSPDEIEMLRSAAEQLTSTNDAKSNFILVRNRYLLELLLGTGLRADEVRLVTVGQLGEDGGWFKNIKTKGRKYRNVYLSSALRLLTEEYLSLRAHEIRGSYPEFFEAPLAEQKRFPLLISLRGANLDVPESFALNPKTIWRIISDFSIHAMKYHPGSESKLHPHKLRHTFAHGLLDSSKDIRLVAQALGHSDVRTTMRYTERTDEEIAKAVELTLKK